MPTEIDALSLNISASNRQAINAIDALIAKMKNLDMAFRSLSGSTSYANNLETATHALTRVNNAVSSIDASQIGAVARSLKSLSSAAKSLSSFGDMSALSNSMRGVSSNVRDMADSIAKSFNIKDKNVINDLARSIQTMQQNVGKGDAYYDAEAHVESLIKEYSKFDNKLAEVNESYKLLREYLNDNVIYIPKGVSDEQNFKQNRGRIGIKNTTSDPTKGIGIERVQSELESMIPELRGIINPQDIFGSLANYLESVATPAMVGFDESVSQGSDASERLQSTMERLASSMGVVIPNAEQIQSAIDSVDFSKFADISDYMVATDDAVRRMRDSLQGVSQSMQNVASSFSQTQEQTQPFQSIVSGLESLQGVKIGDFSNISVLAEGVNKLGYQSSVTASQTLPLIADGLRQFNGFTLPNMGDMEGFASGLRSLGSKAVQNAAYALPFIADGLKQFQGLTIPKLDNLTALGQAVSTFGRAASQRAIANIPQLASSFQQLFTAMSKAPTVAQNTIDAANAFARLASSAGGVRSALTSATPKLNLWSASANKAAKSTFSLAAAIGKVYATYWMLFRVFGIFKKSIDIASDLTEVRNVVYHAFDDMAYKAIEFSKTAGDLFGMSKLDALDAASRYQAMGKTMGITNDMVIKANDRLRESLKDTLSIDYVNKAYGDLGNTAADMSLNLTRLAGDLASLYNTDIEVAAEKLNSIFTGTTKPLREFGFDLTQATLKEWALTNGINANVKSMTQAEKAVLRYQYVMANADFVLGDFVRTADSWHNTIVRLKLAFKNLGAVVGQGFINLLKPVIQKFTAFINTLTGLIQKAINAIGKLLGWQMEIDPVAPSGGFDDADGLADAMEDAEDASGGTADNLEDGAKAAKKMKDYLLGIDELNVFRPDKDTSSSKGSSGSGSGSGSGGGSKGGATGGGVKFVPYESDIDSWWELGNTIANKIGEALWNIDWDSIKKQAAAFATNLAEFLNGFIDSDIFWTGIGHTIAEALNTALVFAETFIDKLKWGKLGQQIGNLINQAVKDFEWDRLGRTIAKGINAAAEYMLNLGQTIDFVKIGEGIAEAINNFFETWDSRKLAKALNVWVDNLWDLIKSTLSNLEWSEIWEDVKGFFDELELDTLTVIIAGLTWKFASKAIIEGAKKALLAKLGSLFVGISLKDIAITLTGFTLTWQGTPSFDAIIAPLVEKFDREFSAAFPNLADLIGRALAGGAGGGLTGAWIGMFGGPIGVVVGAVVGALIGAFTSDVFEPVRNAIATNLFNFDFSFGLFDEMKQHFITALNSTDFAEVGIEIIEGIVTGIAGALSFLVEPIADLFTWTYKEICKVFGIESPAKEMKPIGENILLGIVNGFRSKFSEFTKAITDWFNNYVKPWFTLKRWEDLAVSIKTAIINKWNETVTQWKTNITNWWNNDVLPWFNLDKWKIEADHIRDAIITKFTETVNQWITKITNWWNQNVVPWLKLDKWKTEADHIRDAIITKFNEMVSQWATAIANWWEHHVKPWFTLEKWKELASNIKNGILGAIDDVAKEWGSKIQGLVDKFKEVFNSDSFKKIGEDAISNLVSGLEGKFNAIKGRIQAIADGIKNILQGIVDKATEAFNSAQNAQNNNSNTTGSNSTKKPAKKADGGVFSSGRWHNVTAYASGGMPDSAQLFMAREAGPELVGTIGNNTAVVNNEQIVASVAAGVQSAVTQALSPYLSEISNNTRITASKDLTLNIGDRQIAEANNRGQRSLGAALLT